MIIHYFDWRARGVPTQPRLLHFSPEFHRSRHSLRRPRRDDLDGLLRAIEQGRDLGPNLSTQAGGRNYSRARPRLDALRNTSGVHHLHTSMTADTGTHNERTRELLFVAFTRTDAYVVDVRSHEQMTALG